MASPTADKPQYSMRWLSDHPDVEPLLILLAAFLLCTMLFFGIVSLDPDNGRDYVVADLLTHGHVLYRDVVYFFGPFAPWHGE